MSHSLKVVRIAAVCWAMTSCAAILRRSGDIFLRVNRPLSDCGAGFSCRLRSPAPGLFGVVVLLWPPVVVLEAPRDFAPRPSRRLSSAARLCRFRESPADRAFSSVTIRRTAGERRIGRFLCRGSLLRRVLLFGGRLGFRSSVVGRRRELPSSIVATTSPIFTSWPSATSVSGRPLSPPRSRSKPCRSRG